jgi:hypothetical protein
MSRPRESSSHAIKIEVDAVHPDPSDALEEYRFVVLHSLITSTQSVLLNWVSDNKSLFLGSESILTEDSYNHVHGPGYHWHFCQSVFIWTSAMLTSALSFSHHAHLLLLLETQT